MDLAAKRRLGEGWMGWVGPRPGGRRGGSMIRFAESDSDSEICNFGNWILTRLSPAGAGRIQSLRTFRLACCGQWAVGNWQ